MKKKKSKEDDKLFESYPPLFRQAAENHRWNVESISSSCRDLDDPGGDIPVIDLESLSLERLSDACENWGLFRLVNHGVPAALLTHLHDSSADLFSLPFETKQALLGASYFWGTPALSPSGTPLLNNALNSNCLEGFFFYATAAAAPPPLSQHPILNTFRNLVQEYGNHMGRIARALFEAMTKNLNMNSDQRARLLSEETGILRVYRYPIFMPWNENNNNNNNSTPTTWGMDAHTDSSVISILMCQDEVASLEFLKDDGNWHLVKPVPNTLTVHLGDMIQAMSDDKYRSVRHRVRVNKYKERLSIGYFVFPEDDHVIVYSSSSKYKPFSYSDFRAQVQLDIQTIGRKIGLDRFKLKGHLRA